MQSCQVKQRGSAIIVALFIMSIAVVLSFSIFIHYQMHIRQSQLLLKNISMQQLASGSTTWAMDTLNENWKNKKENALVDRLPARTNDRMDGYIIESTLFDAQGFFNLNNMKDAAYQNSFVRLLLLTNKEGIKEKATGIESALKDWILKSEKKASFDAYYAKQKTPYRSPHQTMVSRSELKLIAGMDPIIYKNIRPYVIALPSSTKMNINSISSTVFASLFTNLSIKNATEILRNKPYANVGKMKDLPIFKNLQIDAGSQLTTLSEYFLLKTKITTLQQHLILYTLFKRDIKENKPNTHILWQTLEVT